MFNSVRTDSSVPAQRGGVLEIVRLSVAGGPPLGGTNVSTATSLSAVSLLSASILVVTRISFVQIKFSVGLNAYLRVSLAPRTSNTIKYIIKLCIIKNCKMFQFKLRRIKTEKLDLLEKIITG
jgi:hypothetical protein